MERPTAEAIPRTRYDAVGEAEIVPATEIAVGDEIICDVRCVVRVTDVVQRDAWPHVSFDVEVLRAIAHKHDCGSKVEVRRLVK